jgi:uncharacterized RDD family membrane protein YckC
MAAERELTVHEQPVSGPDDFVDLPIAGLRRRTFAFIIDAFLLVGLSYALCFGLFGVLAYLGPWARLLGVAIALAYFGILNCRIGRGQTLGKRLLKVEVVGMDGGHISIARSLGRYSVLAVPLFLNGAWIPSASTNIPLMGILDLLTLGIGGAILYLYVFNRRTHQSLHDLAARTYVIQSTPRPEAYEVAGTDTDTADVFAEEERPAGVWKGHFVVIGIWLVGVLAVSTAFPLTVDEVGELKPIVQELQATGDFHVVSASAGRTLSDDEWKDDLTVACIMKENPSEAERLQLQYEIAAVVFDEYPQVMEKDFLTVEVVYACDLGLARVNKGYALRHEPVDWISILLPIPGEQASIGDHTSVLRFDPRQSGAFRCSLNQQADMIGDSLVRPYPYPI